MHRLLGMAIALGLACFAHGVAAETYPSRPIRLISPNPAGGANDTIVRVISAKMSSIIGGSIVVDNRGGAGGKIGADAAAKSAPDGYTLLAASVSTHSFAPAVSQKLSYDPVKDFEPISLFATVQNLLVVSNPTPVKNVQELIALGKSKPGYLIAGHAGVGTSQHLGGELFMSMTGVKIQQVPYRGTTAVLPDLMAGRLNIFFGNISNVLPLVREGKLRAFGITSRKRSPQIPELPTMEELGFSGFDATAWFGMMAPAGTPQPIVDKINAETRKFAASPDVRQKLEGLGLQLVGNSPAEFAKIVQDEIPAWGTVIRKAGIKAAAE